MADDPILRLSRLRIIKASADLEVQIATKSGSAPTLEILRRLRERAAESLQLLAFLNFHDPQDIIKAITLQNEIKRYDEWVAWMGEIISEGKAYDQQFSDAEREEFLDVLVSTPEGQQEAISLGLVDAIPQGDG